MKFIGRERELQLLEKEYMRDSGFVVLYGRRRVGKTTLIKEFIKDKTAFYFLATQEMELQNKKRFVDVISKITGNEMLRRVKFEDWVDIFQLITAYQPEQKKVIVIDEFPYLVKTNPAFPSVLQYIWDEYLKDQNVMLILCGSLLSMMKKHALSYESPLYGRRTTQMRLQPLPFMTVNQHCGASFEQCVEHYAVTGGIPKYMEFFDPLEPLIPQLEEVVFSTNGFLHEEPNFLLNDEVNAPMHYFTILRTIANGNQKLNAIASILQIESSKLTPYLATLMELGFIEKRVPVTEANPEKSRKGMYRMTDSFMRFWFRYVYPYRGELELGHIQLVLDEMQKDFTSKFAACVYEDICQEIFAHLCVTGKVDFVPSKIGRYWKNDKHNDIELDLVAIDQQHKKLFVGECKYHQKPVDTDVYFALQKKVEQSDLMKQYADYKIYYGLFSKSYFTQRTLDICGQTNQCILIHETDVVK